MPFRWNGRARVALATWVASASVLAGMTPAGADDASVKQLEARLAQSRAHLNDLYAASASAGRQFTAASAQLVEAERDVARERAAARSTRSQLADQSAAVADLTVQQLQEQTGVQRLSSLLNAGNPQRLLEKSAAYDSAAEAMTAQVDELSARTAVHVAAQHRFEEAEVSRKAALAQLATNRATINAAIATSQRETQAASAERRQLIQELAAKKHQSIETVTAEQNRGGSDTSIPGKPKPDDSAPATNEPKAPDRGSNDDPGPPPADEGSSDEPYGVWDKIAKCESGGNWHINTGNGYYGGLQFSAATWKSVGGPGLPHQQSREVQIKYAKILQARSGWGQWSCAGARFD
jgi:hypothetical protein